MTLTPVAVFRSPLTSKFGVPRQSGLVGELSGEVVFLPPYRNPDFIRGLEGFDYIWLLWEFSANRAPAQRSTVRPPLLGGNQSLGVFATRSPFRPCPIGLSSVRVDSISYEGSEGPVIHVLGADLMDGTPIFDIKPYVEYADSHVGVRSGFVDEHGWRKLQVQFDEGVAGALTEEQRHIVADLLSLDPRPHYHHDLQRIYGMPYAGRDILFRVRGDILTVVGVKDLNKH